MKRLSCGALPMQGACCSRRQGGGDDEYSRQTAGRARITLGDFCFVKSTCGCFVGPKADEIPRLRHFAGNGAAIFPPPR